MNLQRLRYFLAVADELHFGRAAERLHMAQPPLSQQIRLLETELGVQLFDRTTRRVSLTAAGAVFRVEAERVVVAADSAERVMEEFRSGEGGLLRLAFIDSASFEVMPRYLRAFRQRWPKVKHDLQIMSSSTQVDALHSGVVDLAISRTSPRDEDIVSSMFLDEPLFFAVGPDHEVFDETAVAVKDIDTRTLIGFDRRLSPTLHDELQQLFDRAGSVYDPQIEATEYTTILGLVSSGEGSAVVPNGVRTFQPEGVRYIEISDADASMAMYLNHRAKEPLRVVAQARDVISELFISTD
ncbi:MAG: DNA-binding transcriptional LysR family regulator [Verrucomicrobiales bacterium]|jgi:DNA-binding transcriptional LysR family regulator